MKSIVRHRGGSVVSPKVTGTFGNITPLTIASAAAYLSIGKTSIYHLMRTGALAYTRVGSRRRIPREAIDAYLRANLVSK